MFVRVLLLAPECIAYGDIARLSLHGSIVRRPAPLATSHETILKTCARML